MSVFICYKLFDKSAYFYCIFLGSSIKSNKSKERKYEISHHLV